MMNLADRLIVALDGDAAEMGSVFLRLHRETSARWFKVGPQMLLRHSGMIFIENMMREDGVNLFYDGKVYDTRDTVTNTVRRSFDLGVRFITVHSTPSVMEAAMRAKPADERCKVLAVTHLTDDGTPYSSSKLRYALSICDGVVGSYVIARYVRQWLDEKSPTIISPGIRLPDKYGQIEKTRDNHDLSHVATASEALQAGADYLVVGRAITQAPDLIAAARAIISEMESAHLRAPENADWTTDTAGKCCR